jgi:hypothetical protein
LWQPFFFFFVKVVSFHFLLQALWACSNPNYHMVSTFS